MAIVIPGKTRCAICNQIIEADDEIVAFSPFIPNKLDPLWIFNDAAAHAQCFWQHPLAAEADRRWNELQSSYQRMCCVCCEKIDAPDDYYQIPHLTDDRDLPLWQYQYNEFHRSHLSDWNEIAEFRELLETLEEDPSWSPESLSIVLGEIDQILGDK